MSYTFINILIYLSFKLTKLMLHSVVFFIYKKKCSSINRKYLVTQRKYKFIVNSHQVIIQIITYLFLTFFSVEQFKIFSIIFVFCIFLKFHMIRSRLLEICKKFIMQIQNLTYIVFIDSLKNKHNVHWYLINKLLIFLSKQFSK